MFTIDLFEQISRPVTICFGRMNPPTLGHKQLLKTVADNAGNGDFYIFATKTHKLPDNPLPYDVKFKFLQAMFPEYANNMVYNPELKTIMQVAQWLYSQGYTELNFVAGSDRLPEFEKLLKTYNGKGQPGDKGYYIFTNINMISAGDRDPDAEGLSGISASKARAAAAAGNFEDFVAKTGAGELARPLYDAVREAMNVSEDIAADSESTASPIHGGNIEEEAAGVGVVATNKKMARDPRYSMSITQDVKPTTPKNMLRALKLAEQAITEKWSQKQRKSVDCNNPKGFSQKAHCAGRKARQAGKHTKSKPVTESKHAESASVPMIKKFLPIAKKALNLDQLPKIKIQRHVEVHDGQATFGRFVNGENAIYVGIADRHPVDVLRTLAHELVHWRQFLDGRIKPGSGETGSPIENEAHAIAGVLMRHFNKKYPDAIKLNNIELKESQDYITGNIDYNSVLNPVAWDGENLKPEVRDRLLKISGEFVKHLEVPGFDVLDVVLTGSMANYNWTKYSDFDLHVITKYSDLECEDLAETFYRAKKELWNNYHDITIGGHEVEMYVEDVDKPPVSAGIFSILDNRWIKKPEYNKPEFDKSAINAKVTDLRQQIKSAIESADNISDIQRIKDKLRRMRRAGLDAGGEFSVENLSYKILRNMGILNKMSDIQTKAQDKKLSLPEDMANTSGKLVIFDIDDTLVNTDTRVNVVRDGNVVKTLNSQEFTHYKLGPGEQFDFGRFRDAEEFAKTAKPILPMINQLNKDIATGNKVVMVTARADFNDKDKFLNTFRDLGVNIDGVDHVYRSGNIQDKIPTEAKKRRVIANLLSKNLYDKAIMYDDAIPNLDAFLSLRQDFPHTDFYAWHVDHDGGASEYHKTTYKEEFQKKNKLNEKKRRKKRKARLVSRPFYGYYYGLGTASDSSIEGGDGGMAESQDDESNNLPSINLARQNISRILAAAQRIYDEWDESDRDTYAGGGICHIIADAICNVMWDIGIECTTVSCSYEQHVYVAVKVEEGIYTIDIPYSIYETGGGFNWQKLPDIKFSPGDVVFYRVSGDPEEFENYTSLEEGELIPWPKGTVKVDVSDVYDWYKLGQHISNLKGLGKHDFGKGPPQTVMAFGSEPLEHEYIKDLNKIGLKTYDIDEGVAEGNNNLNFEEGDCPIFAIALHRLSKLPLMALVEFNEEMGRTVLVHAYVKLDDQWRVDASGETNVPYMLAKFPNNGAAEEVQISEKDLIKLGYGKNKCPALSEVLPHAKEVLQEIGQGVAENNLTEFAPGPDFRDDDDRQAMSLLEFAEIIKLFLGSEYTMIDRKTPEQVSVKFDPKDRTSGHNGAVLYSVVRKQNEYPTVNFQLIDYEQGPQVGRGRRAGTAILKTRANALKIADIIYNTMGLPKQDRRVEENFADGKNPGRKGLAKRMEVPTKASVSRLRQIAKSSSGEKQRMAHWMANMKAGKRK